MKDIVLRSLFPDTGLQQALKANQAGDVSEKEFAKNLFSSKEREEYIPLFLECLAKQPTKATMGRLAVHYKEQYTKFQSELSTAIQIESQKIFYIFKEFIQKKQSNKQSLDETISAKNGIQSSQTSTESTEKSKDQEEFFFDETIDLGEFSLDAYRALKSGLSDNALKKLAFFIQTELPEKIKDGETYFARHAHNLPCSVEFEPENKKIFIHLKEHTIKKLGSGKAKKVCYSIDYNPKTPTFIASLLFKDQGSSDQIKQKQRNVNFIKECEFLKEITRRKCLHLPSIIAVTSHVKAKTGEMKQQILQKIYVNGTLKSVINEKVLQNDQKVQLVKSLLASMAELHGLGYVHRDLHPGNFLVDENYNAVLSDFGKIEKMADLKGERALATDTRLAPEALFPENMKGSDYEKSDLFAIAHTLHSLIYGKAPAWVENKMLRPSVSTNMKEEEKKSVREQFEKTILETTDERRTILENKKATEGFLSQIELVEYITLQLLHPNPVERKTAAEWVALLQINAGKN
jgi:serine/threonine protein kinase